MNKLIHADVIDGLSIIEDRSVDLLVTSPPYGTGMDYEHGDIDPDEYWKFTRSWLNATYRKVKYGGYACVNIPTSTVKFGTSFMPKFFVATTAAGFNDSGALISWVKKFDDSGRLYRKKMKYRRFNGRIKFNYASEMIMVLHVAGRRHLEVGKDLTEQEQYQWGVNVWSIQPESDRTHPAPFPIELPHRLIKIFSNPGDTVIDPFIGSGTTMIAAQQLDREFVGIDNSLKYLEQSAARVNDDVEWHYVT